ncbi:MAG: hypothetical protein MJA27_33445 [Pseudanabaenales cyanobacterium]|nr:hypothetical protein [Pseudanabaenales cyanobacterium]
MPKRFTIGPLGEHDDHWLAVWSALTGKSKAALATSVIGLRVKQNKDTIQELLEYSAKLRGISADQLFDAILSNPRYLEENPIPEDYDDDESSSANKQKKDLR